MKLPIVQHIKKYRLPFQRWHSSNHRESFGEECKWQSLMLLQDPQEAETVEWLASVANREGWN